MAQGQAQTVSHPVPQQQQDDLRVVQAGELDTGEPVEEGIKGRYRSGLRPLPEPVQRFDHRCGRVVDKTARRLIAESEEEGHDRREGQRRHGEAHSRGRTVSRGNCTPGDHGGEGKRGDEPRYDERPAGGGQVGTAPAELAEREGGTYPRPGDG